MGAFSTSASPNPSPPPPLPPNQHTPTLLGAIIQISAQYIQKIPYSLSCSGAIEKELPLNWEKSQKKMLVDHE